MPAPPPDRPGTPSSPPGLRAAPPPARTGDASPARPRCPRRPDESRPLPDPAAMRLCLIPDSAPPYDGEAPAGRDEPAPGAGRPGDGAGPAGGRPAAGPPAASGPEAADPAASPGWPSQFAQVLAETLAGVRPARQMTTWTTERARNRIQRLGPQLAAGQRPRVRRVTTFRPTADVMEMTVVVGFGGRVRALAVRLERAAPVAGAPGRGPQAARWRCTTVEAA